MKIYINLPVQFKSGNKISLFEGVKLKLRIFLPENMVLMKGNHSISGAELLSLQQLTDNISLAILLRLKDELIVEVSLPLEKTGSESNIVQTVN